MDKAIYRDVCVKNGHHITDLAESDRDKDGNVKVTYLQTGAHVIVRRIMCIQCGAEPPFEEQRVPRPRSKKAKADEPQASNNLKDLDS